MHLLFNNGESATLMIKFKMSDEVPVCVYIVLQVQHIPYSRKNWHGIWQICKIAKLNSTNFIYESLEFKIQQMPKFGNTYIKPKHCHIFQLMADIYTPWAKLPRVVIHSASNKLSASSVSLRMCDNWSITPSLAKCCLFLGLPMTACFNFLLNDYMCTCVHM